MTKTMTEEASSRYPIDSPGDGSVSAALSETLAMAQRAAFMEGARIANMRAQPKPKPDRILPTLEQAEKEGGGIETLIAQGVGAASVCWENTEGAGVFDSDRAKRIVDEIDETVKDHFVRRSDILRLLVGEGGALSKCVKIQNLVHEKAT